MKFVLTAEQSLSHAAAVVLADSPLRVWNRTKWNEGVATISGEQELSFSLILLSSQDLMKLPIDFCTKICPLIGQAIKRLLFRW